MSDVVQINSALPNPGTARAAVNTTAAPTAPANSNLNTIRDTTPMGFYHIGVFGGKDRYIKFDLNAFAQMEIEFGSMEEAEGRLQKGTMSDVRTVLWLGLIHDEAIFDNITGDVVGYGISKYTVGSWLTTLNLKEVMEKLQMAISASLPEESKAPVVPATLAPTEDMGSTPN